MFWPIGINLVFYTLTTLNGLISIPLQLAFGIVPANAFIVYFELIIAAFGMWLFVRWVFAHHLDVVPFSRNTRDGIALLAAIVYAFGSSKWIYLSLGQFNIAASHWLPWAVLYLSRMWTSESWKRGLRETALCALFVLFTAWTELTYASFFIQLAGLLWLWLMLAGFKNGQWERMRRYTLLCVTLGLLFTLGISPILWLMIQDMRVSGDFLVEGQGFANVFSNDLLGFFVPGNQHPFFGEAVSNNLNLAYLNFAFVGWLTLLLGVLALIQPKTRIYAIFWALFAAIFGLLSLGPTLRINGQEWELPMPFDLMLQIPIIKANRYPSRYSVMIAFCFAIMVAWGVVALLTMLRVRQQSSKMAIITLLAGLLLFEHLGAPLPLSDYRVPEIYEKLKEREGAALLEIPLAWRNGFRVTGTLHNAFMFAQAFQSTHEKRLLSGNTSRNPEFKFQYFTELPLINSLLALETGKPLPESRLHDDALIAPELLRLLDSPNIVVRRLSLDQPSIAPEATLPYLEGILETRRWYDEQDYVGLEVTLPAAPARYEWDASHPLAPLFFAEGWSAVQALEVEQGLRDKGAESIYAEQGEARLLMPSIAAEGDWQLRFETYMPEGREMAVTILMTDPAGGRAYPLSTLTLQGQQEYAVTIPATLPRQPLSEIIFRFGDRYPVEEFIRGQDLIEEEEKAWPFTLLVESAGLFVGNLAHIYVNGVDLVTTQTGYHIAQLSPEGEVLAVKHFDTFNQPDGSRALATFIEQAPAGTIVALAAADTISQGEGTSGLMLGEEVIRAFESLGASSTSDLRGCYACSHALIGIKGAQTGTALEDASAIRPARLFVGAALHNSTVAARFDGFVLEGN
jgi:hypothetical protein